MSRLLLQVVIVVAEMDRLQNHIPSWVGLNLKRLRGERAIWVRVPTGVALIGAGVLGFLPLPIVGIWMLPVGLALLAHDIPTMRRPMARLLHFTNRKIEDLRNRSGRSPHWVKVKNPNAPAVKREVEEDWGR